MYYIGVSHVDFKYRVIRMSISTSKSKTYRKIQVVNNKLITNIYIAENTQITTRKQTIRPNIE